MSWQNYEEPEYTPSYVVFTQESPLPRVAEGDSEGAWELARKLYPKAFEDNFEENLELEYDDEDGWTFLNKVYLNNEEGLNEDQFERYYVDAFEPTDWGMDPSRHFEAEW